MTERGPNQIARFRRYSPIIETAASAAGLAAMAGVAVDPDRSKEISNWSPVGISAIAETATRIGMPESVAFAAFTILFGAGTAHGVWRRRRRQERRQNRQ